MGTAEGHKEPGQESDTERKTQRGKEGNSWAAEEGEERWRRKEDWLLSTVSILPANHRDAQYWGLRTSDP